MKTNNLVEKLTTHSKRWKENADKWMKKKRLLKKRMELQAYRIKVGGSSNINYEDNLEDKQVRSYLSVKTNKRNTIANVFWYRSNIELKLHCFEDDSLLGYGTEYSR